MFVKLFEQWVSEEIKKASYTITIDSYEGGKFDVIAEDDDRVESQFAKSYTVNSSTNPNIKSGASIAVSPIVDKEGEFDVMVVNDPSTGEDILNYSGKVQIETQETAK
jgi:hypothetical protein